MHEPPGFRLGSVPSRCTAGAFILAQIVRKLRADKTLAKSKAPPAAPFSSRCGVTLLLRQFRGEASVLDQILSLEKKVFAKKSSWTGQAWCKYASVTPTIVDMSFLARRRFTDRSHTAKHRAILHRTGGF